MCMVTALAPVFAAVGSFPELPSLNELFATAAETAPKLLPRSELEHILFDTCNGCNRTRTMSAIPQGVLTARSVALNEAKKRNCKFEEPAPHVNTRLFEHPPLKYNSKMMNSIWGLYNRYSVHNFKKNTSDAQQGVIGGVQQPCIIVAAAATNGGVQC